MAGIAFALAWILVTAAQPAMIHLIMVGGWDPDRILWFFLPLGPAYVLILILNFRHALRNPAIAPESRLAWAWTLLLPGAWAVYWIHFLRPGHPPREPSEPPSLLCMIGPPLVLALNLFVGVPILVGWVEEREWLPYMAVIMLATFPYLWFAPAGRAIVEAFRDPTLTLGARWRWTAGFIFAGFVFTPVYCARVRNMLPPDAETRP